LLVCFSSFLRLKNLFDKMLDKRRNSVVIGIFIC